MASQRAAGQRFRQRKLSTKQNLAILRENEVEAIFDDEAQRNIPRVETGVEKAEEAEHHLQAVISSHAAGAGASTYIPTPPTNLSGVQYERLYTPTYHHPTSYIRFSSTVEDSIGSAYCMSQEDEVFLLNLNATYKKSSSKLPGPCTEDQFEEVMSFFEETSSLKQPYATLDNAPVLSLAEMEASFDDTIDESSRIFAKDIYEHWAVLRLAKHNYSIMPSLKFERNADTDESDPFVCFRRREVRQARKTRGRDAQITEKLKKMRLELEQGRQLMYLTKQRETTRREQLNIDRQIFKQRCAVKEIKRSLGIKGDDQDLINQKPVERAPKPDIGDRRISGMLPKAALRPEGRLQDHDLTLLSDDRKKREIDVEAVIQESMAKHRNWNNGWVDNTWRPITPPLESAARSSFRTAITECLPTPPSSSTSEQFKEAPRLDAAQQKAGEMKVPFRYGSPPLEMPAPRPSFRRRMGRGGRMWIDRRSMARPRPLRKVDDGSDDEDSDYGMSQRTAELIHFDIDSDEDTEVYNIDPYDNWNMRWRLNYSIIPSNRDAEMQRRMMIEAQKRTQAAAAAAAVDKTGGATTGTGDATALQSIAQTAATTKAS